MNYEDFDLNLIKTFVSVYECGGIVLASKKLFISQPAVTINIKKLENIVGGKLFVRLPKGVKPTAEGEKFYNYCKSSLNQIKLGLTDFCNFSSLKKGSITIGASSDIINYLLMDKIQKFLQLYPDISINFVEMISKRLPNYLVRGDIDLVFLEDKTIPGDFDNVTFEELENVFFIQKSQNLSKKIDILSKNIAIYKKDSGNYISFEKFCNDNNLDLSVKFTTSNFSSIERLCQICNCVGFAPKKYIDSTKFEYVVTKHKIQNTKINMCFPNSFNYK